MYLIARACQLPHIVHNNSADQRSNEQIGSTKYSNNKAEYVWRLCYYIVIALLLHYYSLLLIYDVCHSLGLSRPNQQNLNALIRNKIIISIRN